MLRGIKLMFGRFRGNQNQKPDPLDDKEKFYVKRGYLAVNTSKLVESPKVQRQIEAIAARHRQS